MAKKSKYSWRFSMAAMASGLAIGGGVYAYHAYEVNQALQESTQTTGCDTLQPPKLLGETATKYGVALFAKGEKAQSIGCAAILDASFLSGTTATSLGTLQDGQKFTIECNEGRGAPSWRIALENGTEGDVVLSDQTEALATSDDQGYDNIGHHLPYCKSVTPLSTATPHS